MFTGLGHILGLTPPRKTESSDGRMGMPKEQINRDGRRKNRRDLAYSFATEDDMSLSARALLVFLQNLLKAEEDKKHIHGAFDKAMGKGTDKDETALNKTLSSKHVSSPSAKAASAYRTSAHYGDDLPDMDDPGVINAAQSMLDIDDIRQIIDMIDDLKYIISKGCTDLHLRQNTSFLSSLETAIALEKSNIALISKT